MTPSTEKIAREKSTPGSQSRSNWLVNELRHADVELSVSSNWRQQESKDGGCGAPGDAQGAESSSFATAPVSQQPSALKDAKKQLRHRGDAHCSAVQKGSLYLAGESTSVTAGHVTYVVTRLTATPLSLTSRHQSLTMFCHSHEADRTARTTSRQHTSTATASSVTC